LKGVRSSVLKPQQLTSKTIIILFFQANVSKYLHRYWKKLFCDFLRKSRQNKFLHVNLDRPNCSVLGLRGLPFCVGVGHVFFLIRSHCKSSSENLSIFFSSQTNRAQALNCNFFSGLVWIF
jgi:hypothetical protein